MKRKSNGRRWHILTKWSRECHSAPHTPTRIWHTHIYTVHTRACLKDKPPGSELLLKATDARNTASHIEPRTKEVTHNLATHTHTHTFNQSRPESGRQRRAYYKATVNKTLHCTCIFTRWAHLPAYVCVCCCKLCICIVLCLCEIWGFFVSAGNC